jgi:hypothetical protein
MIAGCEKHARTPAAESGNGDARPLPDGRGSEKAGAGKTEAEQRPEGSRFNVKWDPKTGKGEVVQRLADGDRYRLCLQCRYPGYSGGTWIGNFGASGFEWLPAKPQRGFRSLNIFCAQDESILDEEDGLEYDAGWSENFGKGDDGVTLDFVAGEVVSDGGAEGDVILRSVNARDCLVVTRYLLWPRGEPFVVISSSIRNRCEAAKRLSFWTGDDPWIGLYKSSDGDVGWYAGGIVRTEKAIPGREFRWGGLYDLGNELLGQSADKFSNVANFIMVDPSRPPPTKVYFANSFPHSDKEIDPARPLDNKTLTAVNLGWTGLELQPGREVLFRYALGRARTGEPGELPTVPEISPGRWRFDEALRAEAAGRKPLGVRELPEGNKLPIQFKEESIRVTVGAGRMEVDALYVFRNRTEVKHLSTMFYPFPIDDNHPYPDRIDVKGARFLRREKGLIWKLEIGPNEERAVEVTYSQECRLPEARYILTTTGRWGEELERADYEVVWPESLGDVQVSYEGRQETADGKTTLRFSRQAFMPSRDLVVKWGPYTCSP